MTHRISAQHQTREVKFPFTLPGNVGAVDITQFALETFVNDLVLLSWRQATSILIFMLVNEVKKSRKRCAEFKAQSATVTQIVNTSEFVTYIFFIEILRMLGIVSNRHVEISFGLIYLELIYLEMTDVNFLLGCPVVTGHPNNVSK